MAYDPSPDMNQSACNEHPHGCGDEPHPRPDFVGFLRTGPTPFTRAEIQVLRDRARYLSIPGAPRRCDETAEDWLYAQLAETLDLLDAVMAREEANTVQPCAETAELGEDWPKKLAEMVRQDGWPTGRNHPSRREEKYRRFDDDGDGRISPC